MSHISTNKAVFATTLSSDAPVKTKRPRSMTTLKLDWLAERFRKVEAIKALVDAGNYHIDNRDVAKSVLGMNPERIKVVSA